MTYQLPAPKIERDARGRVKLAGLGATSFASAILAKYGYTPTFQPIAPAPVAPVAPLPLPIANSPLAPFFPTPTVAAPPPMPSQPVPPATSAPSVPAPAAPRPGLTPEAIQPPAPVTTQAPRPTQPPPAATPSDAPGAPPSTTGGGGGGGASVPYDPALDPYTQITMPPASQPGVPTGVPDLTMPAGADSSQAAAASGGGGAFVAIALGAALLYAFKGKKR